MIQILQIIKYDTENIYLFKNSVFGIGNIARAKSVY